MSDYMNFWWSKFFVDIAIVAVIVAGCCMYSGALLARKFIKQTFCKHSRYRENISCEAVCLKCNKKLGFIADVREKNPRGEK